jgi:hypothetical protein
MYPDAAKLAGMPPEVSGRKRERDDWCTLVNVDSRLTIYHPHP